MEYDIYKLAAGSERAFISTYQDMGYVKDGKLIILSPQQKIEMFAVNYLTGAAKKISSSDSLINEAIAWYQGANYLYKNGSYKMIK